MARILIDKWTTRSTNGLASKAIYKSESGSLLFVKGNSEYGSREPISECLGSKIAALFLDAVDYGIEPAINYKEIIAKGYEYVSVCKKLPCNIIPLCRQVESEIVHTFAEEEDILSFIDREELDTEHLVKVLIVDALIGNEDRHWNNFDLRFNRDKLEWAPALDFGASLMYSLMEYEVENYAKGGELKIAAKPFADNHSENLEVAFEVLGVSNKSLLPNVSKETVMLTLENAFSNLTTSMCSDVRKQAIIKFISERYDKYITPYLKKGRFIQ